MRRILVFIIFLSPLVAWPQSSYAPLNEEYYHKIDRYEIKTGRIRPEIFTSIKPYKRSDIIAFIDSVDRLQVFESKADRFNFEYLHNDSWEWGRPESSNSTRPILKYFYRKKSDLMHVDKDDDFDLHVNPVLYLAAGKDSRVDDPIFINTRGAEIRGMIDRKVGFYSYLTDNQMLLPSYVDEKLRRDLVIPHEGFWKSFKEGKGVDFLQARGYITFAATKHINIQLGHDRTFIGNGYRSLIFSDYAPPSLFFRANVKVWKINYMYQLNRMTADVTGNVSGLTGRKRYPEKYLAFHHLSMNIGKKINIGLFESVIFSPKDSASNNTFEWSYANPIIFYRAIEQQNGSIDNVILGMDFKWNAFRKVSLYGQFVLDEFVLSHIKAGDGWWANKFAVQAGLKYIDALGIPNLDLQGEINIARPFTYSHGTQYGNYSSYRQPLAHPLGANFNELVGILRYQPLPRLNITGKLIMSTVGRDSSATTGFNNGGNIFRDNSINHNDLGNTIGQGFKNDILFGSFTLSWQFKHNLFIDGSVVIRQSKCPLPAYNNNSTITSLALRWNIPQRLYEF
jgi:hypothetical protein